jgi:hypothetical protein
MNVAHVHPGRVVGVTQNGSSYTAIVIDARGRELDDCPHSDRSELLARIRWYSFTAEAWSCSECEALVYRTHCNSPGWVSAKARIMGELTLQAIALAEERLTLRRWGGN